VEGLQLLDYYSPLAVISGERVTLKVVLLFHSRVRSLEKPWWFKVGSWKN